jgi:NitT/TauT family transport system ATP-binding protein
MPQMAGSAPAISAKALDVGYVPASGAPVAVLRNFTLDVTEGEFLTIIGPSGCGKSTFLRVASDLLEPLGGSLTVLGGPASEARRRRDVAFVFQDATLLPWRTAIENVLLPLHVGGTHSREKAESAEHFLELMGIAALKHRYPSQLSGGQRQRVAIARALISKPRILLMDEPFGALDEITRDRLNDELLKLWRDTHTTILFVTHSIMEAVYLGERVMMLAANPGRIHLIRDLRPLKQGREGWSREDRDIVAAMAELRLALGEC